jgi:type II secretory pathway component PulC
VTKAAPQSASTPATQSSTQSSPTPSSKGNALDGAIRRSELLWVHRQGPQQFIQQVRVKPSFRRGRFFGWRIVAYKGPGPVHSGDVIRRINGKPIERPEQFMAVWDNLLAQQELVVEMQRAGHAVTLRYPIIAD